MDYFQVIHWSKAALFCCTELHKLEKKNKLESTVSIYQITPFLYKFGAIKQSLQKNIYLRHQSTFGKATQLIKKSRLTFRNSIVTSFLCLLIVCLKKKKVCQESSILFGISCLQVKKVQLFIKRHGKLCIIYNSIFSRRMHMFFVMFCFSWVFFVCSLFFIIHLTDSFYYKKYPKGTKYQLPHGVFTRMILQVFSLK